MVFRRALPAAALACALLWLWTSTQVRRGEPVLAAEPERAALLVRFGADGSEGDWSGSIAGPVTRVSAWQFDDNDELRPPSWRAATRREHYWDTPYERSMKGTSQREKVTAKGLVVEYDPARSGVLTVTTANGSFELPKEPGWRAPRHLLNGRVEVSRAPAIGALDEGPAAEDHPSLIESSDGALWLAYQSYEGGADRVYARKRRNGVWEAGEIIAGPGDFFKTAVAQDGAGRVWVVWSAQERGNWNLRARAFDGKRWGGEERLTEAPGADIYHSLVADGRGNLHLAWMSERDGNFDIYYRRFDGKSWSRERRISESRANDWEPVVAAAPDGTVAIVWDSYAAGNYDVMVRTVRDGAVGRLEQVTSGGSMEARASARYDAQGRLWIAWDEGDWNWGKDYGQGIEENGRGLLVRRQVRAGVWSGGKLMEPAAAIAEAVPEEFRQTFQQPRLELDGNGNPWLLFRYRVNLPQSRGAEGNNRAMWRQGATFLQNGQWQPMIEMTEGFGRIDAGCAVTRTRSGAVDAVWASEGRKWPSGAITEHNLFHAALAAADRGDAVELAAFRPNADNLTASHPSESEALARVRNYRARARGAEYRIVRGDVHRHTDISWDGNRDGSLDDAYRYALDAASMDYLGVCDHQAGGGIAYNWWRIQKAADLFAMAGRFAPLYSYERSLPWPNGHRNVLFAERGRPVLEIPEAEQRGQQGAAQLYEYLKKHGGITSSHTSATGAGTDWRDSNAELEPVVEIYQGYRRSYEGPTAPRAPTGPAVTRYGAGFVQNAWAKGIKMGVQSSSDHVSTHISYAAFYVDAVDRAAVLRAAKARRGYAATDNLILDVRMGDRLMGDSFMAAVPPPLTAYVRGTGRIQRVEVIRNNLIVYTAKGTGDEMRFTYTDRELGDDENWYYIRVEQEDGQLGWSSPIWVRRR